MTLSLRPRLSHSCLASGLGVLLLGSKEHGLTTELVRPDGSSARSFSLRYPVELSCAIYLAATVILSGGVGAERKVAQYSDQEWLRDLPDLNIDRFAHACSSYSDTKTGVQVTGLQISAVLSLLWRCFSDVSGDGRLRLRIFGFHRDHERGRNLLDNNRLCCTTSPHWPLFSCHARQSDIHFWWNI